MMRCISMTLLLGLMILTPIPSAADERGTAEEAQALLEKAIARYKEVGAEKTFAEISSKNGPFVDGDLYVFVIGPNKRIVAHAGDPGRIGGTMVGMKDSQNKAFGDEILAATPEGIWVDYRWKNYATGSAEQKSSFVKKVDDYIFGCGYYKP